MTVVAVERHGAAVERVHAEHRLDQLGAARALEPGQADDLAGAHVEVDAVDVRVAGARSVSRTSPTSVPGILSGKYDVSGRPTICRTSEASVSPLAGPVLTWRPSLRIVMVWQRSKISLSRWET